MKKNSICFHFIFLYDESSEANITSYSVIFLAKSYAFFTELGVAAVILLVLEILSSNLVTPIYSVVVALLICGLRSIKKCT